MQLVLLLLVSSMAADTCSARLCTTDAHPPCLFGGWGWVGGGSSVVEEEGAWPLRAQFPVSAGTRGSPMMFML